MIPVAVDLLRYPFICQNSALTVIRYFDLLRHDLSHLFFADLHRFRRSRRYRLRCLRNPDHTLPGPPGTGTSIPATFRAIGIGRIPALIWSELCRFPTPGPCVAIPGKFFRGHSTHLILCTKTISFWMVGSRFQKCIYRSAKSVNVTHPRNSSFVIGSIISVRGLQFRSPVFGSHDTAIICTLLISNAPYNVLILQVRITLFLHALGNCLRFVYFAVDTIS